MKATRGPERATLATMHSAGLSAFPDLVVDQTSFARYLGERVKSSEEFDCDSAEDLYLACACTLQHPNAARYFEFRYGSDIRGILGRFTAPGSLLEDVAQGAKADLLVAPPGSLPQIARYNGRGKLLAFVRVVVARAALAQLRRQKLMVSEDALEQMPSADDPELAYLKRNYRSDFKKAFAKGIEELEPRQRTILRYHLVDQLTIDQVGAIYSIHRATAARWVAAARDALFGHTRQALMAQLSISTTEFESVVRLIRSDLDVSVQRLLSTRE